MIVGFKVFVSASVSRAALAFGQMAEAAKEADERYYTGGVWPASLTCGPECRVCYGDPDIRGFYNTVFGEPYDPGRGVVYASTPRTRWVTEEGPREPRADITILDLGPARGSRVTFAGDGPLSDRDRRMWP